MSSLYITSVAFEAPGPISLASDSSIVKALSNKTVQEEGLIKEHVKPFDDRLTAVKAGEANPVESSSSPVVDSESVSTMDQAAPKLSKALEEALAKDAAPGTDYTGAGAGFLVAELSTDEGDSSGRVLVLEPNMDKEAEFGMPSEEDARAYGDYLIKAVAALQAQGYKLLQQPVDGGPTQFKILQPDADVPGTLLHEAPTTIELSESEKIDVATLSSDLWTSDGGAAFAVHLKDKPTTDDSAATVTELKAGDIAVVSETGPNEEQLEGEWLFVVVNPLSGSPVEAYARKRYLRPLRKSEEENFVKDIQDKALANASGENPYEPED